MSTRRYCSHACSFAVKIFSHTARDVCCRPASGKQPSRTLYRPKPRYAKPELHAASSTLSSSNVSFESTDQIREATFREWLAKRNSQLKRRASEHSLKETELSLIHI